MGTQKGPLRLKGSHSDFTFVETKDGFLWKKKARGLTMERIQSDPALIKLRDNINMFSRAGKAVILVRAAFEDQLYYAKDRMLTARLQTAMVKLIKSDNIMGREAKVPQNGDFRILENFELNGEANISRTLQADITASFDRPTGKVEVNVASFVPAVQMLRAKNVTDYKIVCTAVEADFDAGSYKKQYAETAYMPVDNNATAPVVLDCTLTPASLLPVLIVVGVQYAELTNGFTYPERNGEFNALTIVKTDKP